MLRAVLMKKTVPLVTGLKRDASVSDPKSPTPLVAETIDATGLKCPEPVMMLRNALRRVDAGTCLKLVATDPSTLRDIPTMCRFMHHKLVSQDELDGRYEFVVSARALSPQD